jgi:ribosomal protein S18 acetylase RimI-like enzyme
MASIAKELPLASAPAHLRPFDARRDLQAVADLIELGFSDTLDEDGRRYLSQMRSAARSQHGLGWFGYASGFSGIQMMGYVWEEDGRIIGNLSLIPYLMNARRHFLIANVVVHPEHRRKGIGRALTSQGIEHARQAASPAVWLHVRQENQAAIDLYETLGFRERARRTTWICQGDSPRPEPLPGLEIKTPQAKHWPLVQAWLQADYPKELLWHLPLRMHLMRSGLLGSLLRAFSDTAIVQWAAVRRGRLDGLAAWQSSPGSANILWLAAPQSAEPQVIQALLLHARRNIPSQRPLILDFPAGQLEAPLQAAGFHPRQTLIWMEKKF